MWKTWESESFRACTVMCSDVNIIVSMDLFSFWFSEHEEVWELSAVHGKFFWFPCILVSQLEMHDFEFDAWLMKYLL